jgi:hypothetical protein
VSLPALIDCKTIQVELGVTRAAAEAMMRKLEKVEVDGLRKAYVKRVDLERLIRESTRAA